MSKANNDSICLLNESQFPASKIKSAKKGFDKIQGAEPINVNPNSIQETDENIKKTESAMFN